MALLSKVRDYLLGRPKTERYDGREQQLAWLSTMHFWQDRPPFSIYYAELMRRDPKVAFVLAIRNGPLQIAEVEVSGGNEAVNDWVKSQWDRLWERSAEKVLRTACYGFQGFEVLYRPGKGGHVDLDDILDLHPYDTLPLVKRGKTCGISVRHAKSPIYNSTAHKTWIGRPKSLWLTYQDEFRSWFGRSILEKAFPAWYDKTQKGGANQLCRLRMMKDAWVGDVLRYPSYEITELTDDNGNVTGTFSARDLARELADNRASGGSVVLPSDRDELGQYKWDYTQPTTTTGVSQVLEYKDSLNWEISEALGVPQEVIEAATSGSGFSGRSIPFLAFLLALQVEFDDYLRQIDEQILKPMAIVNFGRSVDYTIQPVDLVKTMAEAMGNMGGGEGGNGGGAGSAGFGMGNSPPGQVGGHAGAGMMGGLFGGGGRGGFGSNGNGAGNGNGNGKSGGKEDERFSDDSIDDHHRDHRSGYFPLPPDLERRIARLTRG